MAVAAAVEGKKTKGANKVLVGTRVGKGRALLEKGAQKKRGRKEKYKAEKARDALGFAQTLTRRKRITTDV